jgi:hypothetical protein
MVSGLQGRSKKIMPEPSMDFSAVLLDLQEKRAHLQTAVEGLDKAIEALGNLVSGASSGVPLGPPAAAGKPSLALRSDTFFRMTVLDAAKKFLSMVAQPRSISQITDALNRGGLTCKPESVATIMSKAAKTNEVVKIGSGDWGLPEWYGERKENGTT